MVLNSTTKVQPNQIWQGQDDAHSLIIIARSMVLPYLIGSYLSRAEPVCYRWLPFPALVRILRIILEPEILGNRNINLN